MPRREFSARREVAIGLGMYAVVLLVSRAVQRGAQTKAVLNSRKIYELERRIGLEPAYGLHRASMSRPRLVKLLHSAYMAMNFGLTVGWLMRLYRCRHSEFHRFRRAAVLTTLAAQPFFRFFPCAPPRKLEGFEDTGIRVGGIDFESKLVSQLYNPLAAMPSIHVAYAVVSAACISRTAKNRLLRRLIRGYPAAVTGVVVATGNHFLLDTAAGALLGKLALRLTKGRKRAQIKPPGRR